MGIKFANFVTTTLASAGGITAVATTLEVRPGDGALFPVLGEGDYFYIVVVRDTGAREIMKVTTRVGDVLSDIHRAQDGTAAIPFNENDVIELRITAQSLRDITAAGGDIGEGETIADATMNFSNKTFIDGLTVTGGDIVLGPNPSFPAWSRIRASGTELQLFAGTDYTRSGLVAIRSNQHATMPGTVSLFTSDSSDIFREALRAQDGGTVNIPIGLTLGPTGINMLPTTAPTPNRVPLRDIAGRMAAQAGAGDYDLVNMLQFAYTRIGGGGTGLYLSCAQLLSSGVIIMFGNGRANTGDKIMFPFAFPDAAYICMAAPSVASEQLQAGGNVVCDQWQGGTWGPSTGFYCTQHGTASENTIVWVAIGK